MVETTTREALTMGDRVVTLEATLSTLWLTRRLTSMSLVEWMVLLTRELTRRLTSFSKNPPHELWNANVPEHDNAVCH